MATYSFLDVQASITGPGGSFNLGYGSANSEEGITTAMVANKNTMAIGADGSPMHSLHAGKGATYTINLQQVSPVNQQLSILYNLQTASSALHGKNVISIRNSATGDVIVGAQCAFQKIPDGNFANEGGMRAWVFDVGISTTLYGNGGGNS